MELKHISHKSKILFQDHELILFQDHELRYDGELVEDEIVVLSNFKLELLCVGQIV